MTAVVFAAETLAGHPVSLRTLGVGNTAFAASGSVLDFDGNDYLKVADTAALDQNDRFSLSIWAKPDAAGDAYIIYRANAYYLKLTSSCAVEGAIYYSSAWQTITSSAISCNGSAWTHIEMTYDKDAGGTDELKLYLNGALSSAGDHSASIADTNTDLYIGAQDSTPTLPFDGKIDDLRLYQYARTADEVKSDYNDGLAAHLGKNNQKDDGLVAYWNFEEGSGQTVYDRSGNGNDGTLGSDISGINPVFTSGYTSNGPGGTALKFTGFVGENVSDFTGGNVGNYVQIPYSESLDSEISNSFSIEAWVYHTDNTSYGDDILERVYIYSFGISSSSLLTFYGNGLNPSTVSTTEPLGYNKWYHVAVTYNGNMLKLYVNGVPKASESVTGSLNTGPQVTYISRYAGSAFNGIIDEVRIYNRALSADEIRMHYNQKKPVLHLKMDEGSGTVVHDESFNNNDGTLNLGTSGNTTVSNAWVNGKRGSAISFDGVDDYIDVGNDSSLKMTSEVTIEAWVKTVSTSRGEIVVRWPNSSPYPGYGLSMYNNYGCNSPGQVGIWVGDNASKYVCSGTTTINDGVWHYVVGTYDGSIAKIYVDGVLINSGARTNGLSSDVPLYVGQYPGGGRFNGLIDDVRIYNYARTADEILADYNDGLAAHLR